ncbi:MAG TPA: copper homeostasis protein CutC [Gemmatimonadales bacterium]|nr:copper homeostasis protein CutC [Gemmatimonadales bacterium]
MTAPATPVLLEACVDSVAAARAAGEGGAGRLELCDFSVNGGITPGLDLIEAVRRAVRLPLHVLIRPGGGGGGGTFNFDEDEVLAMMRRISDCKRLGVDGVVLGALDRAGNVDEPVTEALIAVARPLAVTFHRAFDTTPDPHAALEALIGLGIDRVLTSGGAPAAEAGIPILKELIQRAGGRITIMAGGGVRAGNAARIVRETGVRELHSTGGTEGIAAIGAALAG